MNISDGSPIKVSGSFQMGLSETSASSLTSSVNEVGLAVLGKADSTSGSSHEMKAVRLSDVNHRARMGEIREELAEIKGTVFANANQIKELKQQNGNLRIEQETGVGRKEVPEEIKTNNGKIKSLFSQIKGLVSKAKKLRTEEKVLNLSEKLTHLKERRAEIADRKKEILAELDSLKEPAGAERVKELLEQNENLETELKFSNSDPRKAEIRKEIAQNKMEIDADADPLVNIDHRENLKSELKFLSEEEQNLREEFKQLQAERVKLQSSLPMKGKDLALLPEVSPEIQRSADSASGFVKLFFQMLRPAL